MIYSVGVYRNVTECINGGHLHCQKVRYLRIRFIAMHVVFSFLTAMPRHSSDIVH